MIHKLFLVGMLLVSPLRAQEIYSEQEWSVVSQFCFIGPPIVCQIEADSILTPRAVRELEIIFLEFSSSNPPDSALQSADSLMQEIIWRVEFIAEINEKYGGDNTALNRLIVRLKRAQGWVRNDTHSSNQRSKLWDRMWSNKSVDLSVFSSYRV